MIYLRFKIKYIIIMKCKHLQLPVLILFLTLSLEAKSQQLISTASYSVVTIEGSFTASIGETIISEMSDNQSVVSNGFQQFYSDLLTQLISPTLSWIVVKIIPNPVMNLLTFRIGDEPVENTSYILSDLNGNQLREGEVSPFQTQLNVSKLPPAIYLLKIIRNKELIHTAKIIKN